MCLPELASEDSRIFERDASPLSEESLRIARFFLPGGHAYGVADVVSSTTETSLSVILAVRLSVILCQSTLLHSPPYSPSQPKRLRMASSKSLYRTHDLPLLNT